MSTYIRLLALMLTVLPLTTANLGSACGPAPNGPRGTTVDVVFQNGTPFEVDVVINGQNFGTLPANGSSTPTTLACGAGDAFVLSGELRTNAGAVPSPYTLSFTDGNNLVCGETIHVTFFIDGNGDLDLNGFSAR